MKKTEGKLVGEVSDYFSHVEVSAIKASGKIKVGDKIRIKGHTTDFEQSIKSMQINRKDVESAKKGDEIGIKVSDRVRKHDKVYLVN
mgnify:CR=1 FL=1